MKNTNRILIFAIIAVFLTTVLFTTVAGAANNTLTITAEEVSGERGDTVEVVLKVSENPGFAALRITVSESKDFELISVTNGTVMKTMTSGKNILWDSATNSTATGTLVTLTYKISDTAKLGKNVIKVTLRDCFNASLNMVEVSISNIVINVEGQPEVEDTTTVVTPPVETEPKPVETEPKPVETTEIVTDNIEDSSVESTTEGSKVEDTTTKDEGTEDVSVDNGGVGIDTEATETNDASEDSETDPANNDDTTESDGKAPDANESKQEYTSEDEDDSKTNKKGCFGTLSISPVILVILAGAAFVFKKK